MGQGFAYIFFIGSKVDLLDLTHRRPHLLICHMTCLFTGDTSCFLLWLFGPVTIPRHSMAAAASPAMSWMSHCHERCIVRRNNGGGAPNVGHIVRPEASPLKTAHPPRLKATQVDCRSRRFRPNDSNSISSLCSLLALYWPSVCTAKSKCLVVQR